MGTITIYRRWFDDSNERNNDTNNDLNNEEYSSAIQFNSY